MCVSVCGVVRVMALCVWIDVLCIDGASGSYMWLVLLVHSDSDIMKLKTLKGLALQDIITQVHMYIQRGRVLSGLLAAVFIPPPPPPPSPPHL